MNLIGLGKSTVTVAIITSLTGCAATHTALNKRELDVQTKMSETIFLEPAAPDKKIAFVQVRNTSDKPNLDLNASVSQAVARRGYQVVLDPKKANYWVQANVLQVGKCDLRAANKALNQGYGASAVGGLVGAVAGSAMSDSREAVLVGGLLGAGASLIGDALVKDVAYSIITDIQISEKSDSGAIVTQDTNSTLKQGTSGNITQTATESTHWKKYQTRIMSTANKVNLKFEEAEPKLIAGLTNSIANLM